MKEIEIHVHTCDSVDSRLIKIAEDATVEELVKIVQAAGAVIGELEEEIFLLVENEESIPRYRDSGKSNCIVRRERLQRVIRGGQGQRANCEISVQRQDKTG